MPVKTSYDNWRAVAQRFQPTPYSQQSASMNYYSQFLPFPSGASAPMPPPVPAQEVELPEKPRRNLSAYNYFFKLERKKILSDLPAPSEEKQPRNSHGKIGFAKLARTIAAKWKSLDDEGRAPYIDLATDDKERYVREMKEWREEITATEQVSQQSSPDDLSFYPTGQDVSLVSLLNGAAESRRLPYKEWHQPCQQHQPLDSTRTSQEQGVFEPLPSMLEPGHTVSSHLADDSSVKPGNLQVDAPSISELILHLDDECQELLISAFGG